MAQPAADRNLLFGILALQMDFITRDGLVAAMNAWLLQKHRPLADLLEESGALKPAARALLEPLVDHHIQQHGGDPSRSLASLSSVDWILADLAPIGEADPDVQHSLARLVPSINAPRDDPEATADYPRPAGSSGTRFRIIKLHARGGLGEVFVADDAELHREVALKQIQDRHGDDPGSRARFLLEAKITGGLEHPGIVPVYGLGHYDDGRPYYAMRFIKGDSLKEAISRFHKNPAARTDAGARMLELQKLLRRFLDVCNAIAYAHSRGVLHRDIKPGNIMVGQYGETLVVDWGLAKIVGAAEGSGEVTLRPPSASGSSETMPGDVIGTPDFMSPEQAAGRIDRLGPASDVYSLGATLYCLLTGNAPIDRAGCDIDEIIGRVRRGEFPRPRQVEPDVPRAMEAICLKAMAQEPEDRYPTPRALADDLERWLADEPVSAWREPLSLRARRWMRRNRTFVTAAAATVLVGIVALGIAYSRESSINTRLAQTNQSLDRANRQATAANDELIDANTRVTKAKAESDRRLDQTLQAIEDYYTGVGEEVLLGQKEFQTLRRRLLERPRQFYERLTGELKASPSPDERTTHLLAKGYFGLGRISSDLGKYDVARTQYEAAIKLYDELIRAQPDVPGYQSGLAMTSHNLGIAENRAGNVRGAVECYRRAIEDWIKLRKSHPNSSEFTASLGKSYTNLGAAEWAKGDMGAAMRAYNDALTLFSELAAQEPNVPTYQSGLAINLNNIGLVQHNTGDRKAGADSFRQAIAVYSKLTAARPDVPAYQNELARSHTNFGLLLLSLGDPRGAVNSHRQSIAIRAKLVEAQPNIAENQEGLAASYENLGIAQASTADLHGAIEAFRRSLQIRTKLAADLPDVPTYQEGLAKSYSNLGEAQRSSGDLREAIESIRQSIEIRTKLLTVLPDAVNVLSGMGNSFHNLGETLHGSGRTLEAEGAYRRAVEYHTVALERSPRRTKFREFLNQSYRSLAKALRINGRADEAAQFTRLRKGLWEKNPEELYNTGRELSLCVPIARDAAEKQALAAEAIECLRGAITAGWKDAQKTSRDPDLLALRDRGDFRRLVAELFDRIFPADPFGP